MVNQDGLVARYQKYFDNWDESAAVRSKSNQYQMSDRQLNSGLHNKKWFLPAGVPMLTHPLLQGIDQSQEQYLLGRFLLQFLEYGTILEHEFVNTILKELAESLQGIIIDPIYNLFIDHAEDEKEHCMYFSTLLEVIWRYLSPGDKKFLGMYFPKILKTFVKINTIALFEALEKN